jgi:hypothetical protein
MSYHASKRGADRSAGAFRELEEEGGVKSSISPGLVIGF